MTGRLGEKRGEVVQYGIEWGGDKRRAWGEDRRGYEGVEASDASDEVLKECVVLRLHTRAVRQRQVGLRWHAMRESRRERGCGVLCN